MTTIVGILNVTPDSFSDGGRFTDVEAAVARGVELTRAGAAIVDVGGESTRPGAVRVDPAIERERALPVVRGLAEHGVNVSIDTMNAATALAAIDAGAVIVNDVSGGLADPDMFAAVAPTPAAIVLQHWRGHSDRMYERAEYRDVAREVAVELQERVDAAAKAGISPDRLVLDPGIGFGKTPEQSWSLLHGLARIVALGPRVLVGTSRKGLLRGPLGIASPVADPAPDAADEAASDDDASFARRDLATAVTSVLAAQAGAWAVRVHDVAATRDALAVRRAWLEGDPWYR